MRPEWVDDGLFPFESRFVEADGCTVHHVDEGPRDGPVLLMHHGNPTWAFLYRDLIIGLRDRFRCIALDLPGFGLSTPRPGYRFTPAEHADVTTAFVEQLDLTGITPFVQDWGGPIGLAAAVRLPERYRSLIVGNTWVWPSDDLMMKAFANIMGGPVGREAILRRNLFAARLIPWGHSRRTLTDAELAHYTNPFPTRESRIPTAIFPRAITRSDVLLREVSGGLSRIADLPALILWGDQDKAFRDHVRRQWEAALTNATTHVLRGANHYIQDDAPDEILRAITDWWPTTER